VGQRRPCWPTRARARGYALDLARQSADEIRAEEVLEGVGHSSAVVRSTLWEDLFAHGVPWQHPPYFHDGSAETLEAVVQHYEDALDLDLTDGERADLVAYLSSR